MDSVTTHPVRCELPRPHSSSSVLERGGPQSQRVPESSQSPQSQRGQERSQGPQSQGSRRGPTGGRRSRRSIDSLVVEVAKRQLGVIETSQLRAVGVDRRLIQARVDSAMLVRMFPNVVRVASVQVSAEQQFLAAALSVPGSAISGGSAAFVHGFPSGTLRALTAKDALTAKVPASSRSNCRFRTNRLPTSKGSNSSTAPSSTDAALERRQGDDRCPDRCRPCGDPSDFGTGDLARSHPGEAHGHGR